MKLKQFLIAGCIGIMFAACSNKDDYSMQDDNTIKLRAEVVAPTIGTRVNVGDAGIITNQLPSGNQVNVFFYEQGTANSIVSNKDWWKYITGSNNDLTPKEGETEPTWGSSPIDVYAVYPSEFWIESRYDQCIYTNQRNIGDYQKADVLVAQAKNVTKAQNPITLQLKHAMAKIVINFDVSGSGYSETDIKDVKVYANTDFQINISETTKDLVVYGSGSVSNIELGDYVLGGLTCVIPPDYAPIREDPLEYDFIWFTLNGVKYGYNPSPEILLQSGYQYTFNLTIENNKVKAKGVSISPWTTTESECTQNGAITL